ncbi:MAG: hypothetical protein JXR83_07735 [Deltaproteobacteria bacterium]|nr:hypothetical protein [Deltaproteobacteria bacterium]
MAARSLASCALGAVLLAATAGGCGTADPGELDDDSLRAALLQSTDALELTDLPTRRSLGERLLTAAREQVEADEAEQISSSSEAAPIDAVAAVDAEREARALEPMIAAALRADGWTTALRAVGPRDLFAVEHLVATAPDPAVRIDSGFGQASSDALGGRSEAVVVAELSGLIGALGRAADPETASWIVVRRTGLRAGLVFLATAGVVELNPALLYFLSPLGQANPAVGAAPAAVGATRDRPPANDWEVLMRWLDRTVAPSWTRLGHGQQQIDDGDDYDPMSEGPAGCPCCGCSAFGLGLRHPAAGAVALLALALPFCALLAVRRRLR